MVVRICHEANVEARQSVQYVSAGHWCRSFQACFSRMSERNGREKEDMLKKDLEINVTETESAESMSQEEEMDH